MAEKSLEDRASAEAQLGYKSFEEHFREQAELIHRLFAYRFAEFGEKWKVNLDTKLAALDDSLESHLERKIESKLEAKFNAKLEPIKRDLTVIKHTVKVILTR